MSLAIFLRAARVKGFPPSVSARPSLRNGSTSFLALIEHFPHIHCEFRRPILFLTAKCTLYFSLASKFSPLSCPAQFLAEPWADSWAPRLLVDAGLAASGIGSAMKLVPSVGSVTREASRAMATAANLNGCTMMCCYRRNSPKSRRP